MAVGATETRGNAHARSHNRYGALPEKTHDCRHERSHDRHGIAGKKPRLLVMAYTAVHVNTIA